MLTGEPVPNPYDPEDPAPGIAYMLRELEAIRRYHANEATDRPQGPSNDNESSEESQ